MIRRLKLHTIFIIIVLLGSVIGLTGCGGPDTPTLFVMPQAPLPLPLIDEMQKELQLKLGDTKIAVNSSAVYRLDKLFVELAAGGNAMMLLNKEDFVRLLDQGAALPLDDEFNPDDYKEGVRSGTILGAKNEPDRKETHLYGIPAGKAYMLKQLGITDKDDLFLFVLVNAPDKTIAKRMMKGLVER